MIELELTSFVRTRLDELTSNSLGELEYNETRDPEDMVTELVAEYEATRVLIAEQEYLHDKQELEYNSRLALLKAQFMDEGLKSTEAKEQAKRELLDKQMSLLKIEKDISLLKANMHSIEYQLRLKFQQIKNLIDLEVSIDETQV
jgi:hypothetical protein